MSQLPTPPLCVTRQARDETRTPARAIRETHRGAAAALPQLDRVTNAQSPTNTSWADALRARCGPAGGLLKDSPRTCGSPTSRHGLLGVHPISVVRFVAVDFLRVQIADELQDLPADQLAGHQHRKARRVPSRRWKRSRRRRPQCVPRPTQSRTCPRPSKPTCRRRASRSCSPQDQSAALTTMRFTADSPLGTGTEMAMMPFS